MRNKMQILPAIVVLDERGRTLLTVEKRASQNTGCRFSSKIKNREILVKFFPRYSLKVTGHTDGRDFVGYCFSDLDQIESHLINIVLRLYPFIRIFRGQVTFQQQ